MDLTLVLGLACLGVLAVVARQYMAARGQYRPLTNRQPARTDKHTPELGMEAIDMAEIRRTQRNNDSLERVTHLWGRKSGLSGGIDISVDAMPDDETYARRYHAAFKKQKD